MSKVIYIAADSLRTLAASFNKLARAAHTNELRRTLQHAVKLLSRDHINRHYWDDVSTENALIICREVIEDTLTYLDIDPISPALLASETA